MKPDTFGSSRHLMVANACSWCQHIQTYWRGDKLMKISPRIATAVAAVLAVAGAGAGTAMAASQGIAARTGAVTTASSHHQKAGGGNGPENNESAGGSSGPSDGPGGHADPSGAVQYELNRVQYQLATLSSGHRPRAVGPKP